MFVGRRLWRLFQVNRHYRAGIETLPYMPIRLWIDTSSACNLRCIMCPNKDLSPAERGLMSLDLFKTVIDEAAPFIQDANLHHRGEPLLNPDFFEMVAYAGARGVRTRFHTNGTLLNEARVEALLGAAPDLVSFSIDGFEKGAYERVRVGATFENTVENVKRLLARRRERGLKHPYIVIERIRFRNREEPEAVKLAAATLGREFLDAGADEVIVKEEYEWADDSPADRPRERTYSRCTFPWYAMVVSWDGVVTPCPQDFWAKMKMGKVPEQSLVEIWNGEAYRALRRAYGEDVDQLSLCRSCDRLCRKTVGRMPLQYAAAFLTDQLVGYGCLRRLVGTAERNA